MTGAQLAESDEAALEHAVASHSVFARVTPADKLRLVEAYQRRGEVVAVTGDGVNDTPALRRADVGIAMGCSGTEAAREAAEIVLTDDDFATIVAAIEEGRRIGDNVRKFVAVLALRQSRRGRALRDRRAGGHRSADERRPGV